MSKFISLANLRNFLANLSGKFQEKTYRELDSISHSTSSDYYPSSKAVADYVAEHGGGAQGAVRYDNPQTLTPAQKAQARRNIDAPSSGDLDNKQTVMLISARQTAPATDEEIEALPQIKNASELYTDNASGKIYVRTPEGTNYTRFFLSLYGVSVAVESVVVYTKIDGVWEAAEHTLPQGAGKYFVLAHTFNGWRTYTYDILDRKQNTLTAGEGINIAGNVISATGSAQNAVKYTPQTLTDEQKAQARENIGATGGKYGIISQTQTWASDYSGYTMSNQVYGLIPQNFIDLVTAQGASFNAQTGYFECNDLQDLSYEEMIKVYNNGNVWDISNQSMGIYAGDWNGQGYYSPRASRTHFVYANGTILQHRHFNVYGLWSSNTQLNSLDLPKSTSNEGVEFDALTCFSQNECLINIGYLKYNGTSAVTLNSMNALRHFYLKGLKVNLSLKNSRWLSDASILYIIKNANNGTTDITITLHADAYARAIADQAITDAVQANGHITLASA